MTTLSNRFRDVIVTLSVPAPLPAELPATWIEAQTADCVLHFVESDFKEGVSERALADRFPSARDLTFAHMSLRQIFLAIAKSGRHAQVQSARARIAQENEA